MMRHAVRLNSLDELAITKLDVLDSFETLKVCVAYESGGTRYEHLPWHQSVLHEVRPVYQELPGWHTDTSDVGSRDGLPGSTRVPSSPCRPKSGVPITYVGVGPGRDQIIRFN